jgi:flavin reductase (DIM6/NTAB) family NADH-FMN oxidoreductase RutF
MAEQQVLTQRDGLRLLEPGSLALVGTIYRDQLNLMTVAWLQPLSVDPPLIGFAVHPSRLTHEFLSKTEQCTINFPSVDLISAVHLCGMHSGREVDKFERASLTPVESATLEAPYVGECLAHIDCAIVDRQSWGDHDFFVGRIEAAFADSEAFRSFWNVDDEAGRLLHHLGGDRYAALARSYRVQGEDDEE